MAGPARQCGTSELSFTSLDAVGATGNEGVVVELTNTSQTTGLAENYPRVTLDEPGHTGILATSGGFFNGATPTGAAPPRAMAAFVVSGSVGCVTQPSPLDATHLYVQLPGGGVVSVALPGTHAPGSSAKTLTVPMSCGVWATHMYPYPVPPTPRPPADPLAQLIATISLPSSVINGRPFDYVVDLLNPGNQPVVLSPCRGFRETIEGAEMLSFRYELNCAQGRTIAAHGDEPFVIEMPEDTTAPGQHTLCWSLDAESSSVPRACDFVTVLP